MLRGRHLWSQMLGIQHFWNILVHYVQVEKLTDVNKLGSLQCRLHFVLGEFDANTVTHWNKSNLTCSNSFKKNAMYGFECFGHCFTFSMWITLVGFRNRKEEFFTIGNDVFLQFTSIQSFDIFIQIKIQWDFLISSYFTYHLIFKIFIQIFPFTLKILYLRHPKL